MKVLFVAICQSVPKCVSVPLATEKEELVIDRLELTFVVPLVGDVMEGVVTDGAATVVKEDAELQLP